MKMALAVLAFGLLGTGCVVHNGLIGTSHSAVHAASSGDCPPGHRWSDGQCHSTGKGHDPAKHHH